MKSFAHEIAGLPVHALDGDIGTIKDVLFDSEDWRIHFLEVSTGAIFGRDVLLPIEKVSRIDLPEGGISFDLSKAEIEKSPEADTARPVERHAEMLLYPYYGLTAPWVLPLESIPEPRPEQSGPRLIFARDLEGYELRANDEGAGTVRDVLVDLERRKVTSIAADVGGIMVEDVAEVGIGPVTGIDSVDRVVHVDLSRQQIDKAERLSTDDLVYAFPYIPPIM